MADEQQPPQYSGASDPQQRLTDEQRLQALKEWAEEKKYVHQGEDGTLPSMQGGGAWAFTHGQPPDKTRSLAPPSYTNARGEASAPKEKEPGVLKRWLEHRQEKKES